MKLLYLSDADIRALDVPMKDVLSAVESAFRDKAEGCTEVPAKGGIHPTEDAFIHAMPALLGRSRAAGLKWVSAFPGNGARGLPNIHGLIILNDVDTGVPLAVMDARWVTAKRTGAATALSARYLARRDSASLGILGCGVQARTHLEALLEVLPLRRILAYDRHFERAAAYVQEAREKFGLEGDAVHEARDAVLGQDVVVTAGSISKTPHATVQAGWLKPGAFASLVDFDASFSPEAFLEVDMFCTDDTAQLKHFRASGRLLHVPAVHADLAELVGGTKAGRRFPEERTMTCNLGLALTDVATASLLYQRAVAHGVGTWLST
jgi:ornithine cyclodeaminase/alanine dehydrogenase-like protein (mu-crystallin family)